jgi:hypothetical protein
MDMTSLVPATDQLTTNLASVGDVEFVAMLSADDFEAAHASIPDFASDSDYEDWLDDRYGMTVGLCASGVDARMVTLEFSQFLAWCRYARLAPSRKGLDEFASVVAIMRDHCRDEAELTTIATVSYAEFSAYFELLEAFRSVDDYPSWIARREAAVQASLASGAIVCRSPAPLAEFLEWARCLGAGSTEALLDRYAALALEAFACP